jgi:hypothetical protein
MIACYCDASGMRCTPTQTRGRQIRSKSAEEGHALPNACCRDWGRQGLHNQSDVAAVMGEVAHTTRPDFVISTGDNFYDCEISLQGLLPILQATAMHACAMKQGRGAAHSALHTQGAGASTDALSSCCAAGLSSVQDDLFRSSFVDVYSSPSLKGVPWHAVLGCAADVAC